MIRRHVLRPRRARPLAMLAFAVCSWTACTSMESPTNSLENSEAVVLRRATAAEYGGCSPTCALFVTNGPLWSAQADPDSTATHVEIATLTLAGAPGDSVALVLEADSQALSVL